MTACRHIVLMPTYNTGPRLHGVVTEVLLGGWPVLLVVDGSDDGSERSLVELARSEPRLQVLSLPVNSGKGAALFAGAREAVAQGFTHAVLMDSDGQHPAASIPEFVEESKRHPDAQVLGQPVFPANIPPARLHGRKLSVWMTHFEMLGPGIADPLFGFRIVPLQPMLDTLAKVRSGRRYDFDTVAAVRLAWSGVPPRNLRAPVRYFSRDEGGVSHFRYVRDNVTLFLMHVRLVAELLLFRWPAVLRHRRRWRDSGKLRLALLFALAGALAAAPAGRGAENVDALVVPAHRISAQDPAWSELARVFASQPDITADFLEKRVFPFRKTPIELRGEARVSPSRGLSLRYIGGDERVVILDSHGVMVRSAAGSKIPPPDPRAAAANDAMRHIVRFDFAALEKDFELYGRREPDDGAWTVVLVPKSDAVRRSMGRIAVGGAGSRVSSIEIRRSEKQYVAIAIEPPKSTAAFGAEDLARYFR